MADVNAERLAAAHGEIADDKAHAVVTDVTREEEVRALIEQATGYNGRLDILFNNAGVGVTQP